MRDKGRRSMLRCVILLSILLCYQANGSIQPLAVAAQSPSSNSTDALFQRGYSLIKAGKFSEASQVYRELIKRDPRPYKPYVFLGVCYAELGNHEQALLQYKEALRRNTDDPLTYRLISGSYFALSDFVKAVEAAKTLVRLKPDSESYAVLGSALAMRAQYDAAITASKESLRLNPTNANAYVTISYSLIRLDRNPEAIDAASKAVGIDPKLALAYINIGYAKNEIGDFRSAIASAERGLGTATEPREKGIAYYVIAFAREKLGDPGEARTAYGQSISLYKKAKWLAPDDYYYLGNACFFLRDDEQSIDAYKQAIKLRPEFPQPHFNLGVVYTSLARKREALEEYNSLSGLDPTRARRLRELIDKMP
jgi:tetratricopeptide (TPR) repeat protein